jgi:16S rRNA (guanine527-N7)-methyltransferase
MTTTGEPAGPPSELLAVLGEGQAIGYIGSGALEPHVRQALAFAEAVGDVPIRAVDLGSGGGLPGLVLATSSWSTTELTLLDAGEQRTRFLERSVATLGLEPRVKVARGRAELLARSDLRGTFDAVVARAFGAPAVVAECAAAFLLPGGMLVVSEPPAVDGLTNPRWDHDEELAQLGLVRDGSLEIDGCRFQRLRAAAPCPDRFPRRDGVPAKRPLFG